MRKKKKRSFLSLMLRRLFFPGLLLSLLAASGWAGAAAEPGRLPADAAAGQNREAAARAETETSWLLSFVESRLSGPNRRIHLSRLEGALSARPFIGLITVADSRGVWLKIHAARLEWSRLKLLRGRLSIQALRAEKVEILRRPLAADTPPALPQPAAGFAVPQWPVAVDIAAVSLDKVVLAEELAGRAASLSLHGQLRLAGGRLAADISAARLDSVAGEARLTVDYDNKTGLKRLDGRINEGAGGLLAHILALQGRPPLAVSAHGSGRAGGGLQLELAMAASGRPLLDGRLDISPAALPGRDRLIVTLAAGGPVAALLPPVWQPFFAGKTVLSLRGAVKAGGGFRLDEARLKGDSAALSAQADILADGFLRRLWLEGALGGAPGLPSVRAQIDYGAPGAQTWSSRLTVQGWQSAAARFQDMTLAIGGAAENLDNAALRHISAAGSGHITAVTAARPGGGAAALPPMALALAADWRAGRPLKLQQADISGGGLRLTAEGALAADGRFNGAMRFTAAKGADFSAILGQKLATDGVDLLLRGEARPGSGAFNVDISGAMQAVHSDKAGLNGLLRQAVTVSGGLAGGRNGLSARHLRLANAQFQLYANGYWRADAADMDFSLNLADTALLLPFIGKAGQAAAGPAKTRGAAVLRGAARGHNGLIAVAAQAAVAEGEWNGRALRNLRFNLNAMLDNSAPAGVYRRAALAGEGQIGGDNMQLGAVLYQPAGGGWQVDNFRLALGETVLDGFLRRPPQGLWSGALRLKAENIAPLAALALMEGKGKADIAVDLPAGPAAGASREQPSQVPAGQSLAFRAEIDGLRLDYLPLSPAGAAAAAAPFIAVRHLRGEGAISAIFAAPHITGALTGAGLHYGRYNITQLRMNSRAEGPNSTLAVAAELQDGLRLASRSLIAPRTAAGAEWQLLLQSFSLSRIPAAGRAPAAARQKAAAAAAVAELYRLDNAGPARFVFSGRQLRQVEGLRLNIYREGVRPAIRPGKAAAPAFITVAGRREESADWQLSAHNVPLALADMVRPDWGLRGRFSGAAHIRQAAAGTAPAADFALKLDEAGSAATRRAGLAPLYLQAQGQTHEAVLDFDAMLTASAPGREPAAKTPAAAMRLRAGGKIFLDRQALQVKAALDALPLALLPEIINRPELARQAWRGAVTVQALIEGRFDQPQARFTIGAESVTAAFLAAGKIAPLAVRAEGRLDKQALQLDRLALHESGKAPAGGDKPYFTAAGRLPFNGAGLKMQAEGRLPLALANGFLPAQNIQLNGVLTVNGLLAGSWQQPQMQGHFAVQNGQVLLVPVNFRLQPVELGGRLQGSDIIFDKAVLHSAGGGEIGLGGALGVNPQAGFPLRLRLNFNRFRFNDGATIAAEINGALAIGGGILPGMDISGALKIAKAEIRIPDNFGSTALPAIDNKRLNAPIALTQKRAGRVSPEAAAAEKAAGRRLLPRLNIEVSAPNQIFVRGRGLDAEMGGKLHLLGRVDDMRPNGGFKLIRGRFDILAQRLTFREGQVNLAGSLNPDLNFVAVSGNDDVTVTIQLTGTPKNLKIALSSTPSLPQDEILARLIFKRSLSELSPLQVAQLVDAAAELTGATQASVFGKLRAGTGLDNLDITTDSAGNAGLEAGRYIMDKLYMGVETSSAGGSKGTVNLDISKNLKAKGAMGSDSNSSVGVFYERDY